MQLRRFLNKISLVLLLSTPVIIISCDKKEEENRPEIGHTIGAQVFTDSNFSTFGLAIVNANLARTLNETGPFTLFAPDDSAFGRSGITQTFINTLSPGQLQAFVLYHTLNSKTSIIDLPPGPNAKIITASGDSVFITKNTSGIYINGVKITQADINADNGFIHKIDRVLNPPVGTNVGTVVANGLDSLAKAIIIADTAASGDSVLVDSLNLASLTIFAPTNAAFTTWLTALSVSSIEEIPIATLLTILRYHVVPGRVFSSDLADGPLTMLAGGTTVISVSNPPTIIGTGNGTDTSNIIATNIMSRNGVVHLIDRVLLP